MWFLNLYLCVRIDSLILQKPWASSSSRWFHNRVEWFKINTLRCLNTFQHHSSGGSGNTVSWWIVVLTCQYTMYVRFHRYCGLILWFQLQLILHFDAENVFVLELLTQLPLESASEPFHLRVNDKLNLNNHEYIETGWKGCLKVSCPIPLVSAETSIPRRELCLIWSWTLPWRGQHFWATFSSCHRP